MKRFEKKFHRISPDPDVSPDKSGTLDEVFVPAFLLHITELAMALQSGHASAIVNIDADVDGVSNVVDNVGVAVGSSEAEADEDGELLKVPNVAVRSFVWPFSFLVTKSFNVELFRDQ